MIFIKKFIVWFNSDFSNFVVLTAESIDDIYKICGENRYFRKMSKNGLLEIDAEEFDVYSDNLSEIQKSWLERLKKRCVVS